MQTGLVECEVSGADCSMYGSGHKDEPSLGWLHDKSFENLAGTNATTESMDLQNQNCRGGKQLGDFVLSGFGSSESVVVNTQAKCTKLIGMTFCKKAPIADWTDRAFEMLHLHLPSLIQRRIILMDHQVSKFLDSMQYLKIFLLILWFRTKLHLFILFL